MKLLLSLLFLFVVATLALDNGLGKTPQMGWNSWNAFHCSINENLIKSAITKFVQLELPKYGYEYVNM